MERVKYPQSCELCDRQVWRGDMFPVKRIEGYVCEDCCYELWHNKRVRKGIKVLATPDGEHEI